MYIYSALVTEVYDGDTITVDIDLGFYVHLHRVKVRLFGINAPEIRGDTKAQGLISRNWLRSMVLNQQVMLKTYKDRQEKYGRWLATVFVGDGNVNELAVAGGYAIRYMEDVL